MFEQSLEELKALGADITTAEIKQQPDLWEETYRIYEQQQTQIAAFLQEAQEMAKFAGKSRVTVILTGAGTSQYVGDTIAPYLTCVVDPEAFEFQSIATTSIVSTPADFLRPDEPTILVSYARSGNSPESLATVQIAKKFVKNIKFLHITCAPEGRLATEATGDKDTCTILLPGANDKGFAMTGSYSCMTLATALVFDPASNDQKKAWVQTIAQMGRDAVAREEEIAAFLADNPERVIYLGSGSFGAATREAQLKILELAAGKTATMFDTSMGFRHGPKSFINEQTVLFTFVSDNPYTRQYDLDILREVAGDKIAQHTVAIQTKAGELYEGENFTFDQTEPLPEGYEVLPFIMFAQVIALRNSVRVGNTPDTPSPTGTVNRVVKGVTIHEFKA